MWRFCVLLLAVQVAAIAQTAADTITVTSSRVNTATPDLVAISVAVDAPLSVSRDDVIAALQGSGIGLANFTSVYSSFSPSLDSQVQVLEWSFSVTAPLTGLKDAIASLNTLKQTVASAGLTLSYTIEGLSNSAAAQKAASCSQSGLLADARAQAQAIAAAATARVLAIVSISGSVSDGSAQPCSLTVTFALGPAI